MNYEVFKSGREAYVVVDKDFKRKEALRIANQHFKVKLTNLLIQTAYQKGDTLYFKEKKGQPVWVVMKCTK